LFLVCSKEVLFFCFSICFLRFAHFRTWNYFVAFLAFVGPKHCAFHEIECGERNNFAPWSVCIPLWASRHPLSRNHQNKLTSFSFSIKFFFSLFACSKDVKFEGLSWNNWATEGQFTVFGATMMLLFDTVLYLAFAWYFSNIFPGPYGIRKVRKEGEERKRETSKLSTFL
jgi:hypothetical protein